MASDTASVADDRYELGRVYFVPAGHYGPIGHEHERSTLREAVEVVARLHEQTPHAHLTIERREVAHNGHDGIVDQPVARYTADGTRPAEFERTAAAMDEMRNRLRRNVYRAPNGEVASIRSGDAALGYPRAVLRDMRAWQTVLEQAIAEAERELAFHEASDDKAP